MRPACRWSVVKRRPPTRRSVRWTTSSSPSRSSSAPTTSPKPPNSWSPSPPARKNSDPPAGQVHRARARLRTWRKEQKLTAGNRWSGRWKKDEDGKRKGDESSCGHPDAEMFGRSQMERPAFPYTPFLLSFHYFRRIFFHLHI